MLNRRKLILNSLAMAFAAGGTACLKRPVAAPAGEVVGFQGGQWFTGDGFEPREAWSIDGLLTFARPAATGRTVDIGGSFVIPPFADAHNHGIGTGVPERDRAMVRSYLLAGVFYVRSMGNLPLLAADKAGLGLNAVDGLDAVFAQGSITGHGGHPVGLIRDVLMPQGFFPGRSLESLDGSRFHQVATLAELEAKWPAIRASHGDFIKFFLFNSDEYARRRDDPAFFGRRGLDPALAAAVVGKAHAEGLRAAAHVGNVADWRTALDAGVDIVGHLPAEGMLTTQDAQRAADAGVEVITTCGFLTRLARNSPQESAAIEARQGPNLQLLKQAGVRLTIGSDDPADPSQGEIAHLRELGVFNDLELLRMWTGESARAIFPGRQIGALEEGHEASFLALEGNPLADWQATQRIRLRFKRGRELIVQP
jgi:imidazolonepropionase-like amidohydrolase